MHEAIMVKERSQTHRGIAEEGKEMAKKHKLLEAQKSITFWGTPSMMKSCSEKISAEFSRPVPDLGAKHLDAS